MNLGLEGKQVFISASTGGIGLAVADAFLEEGANVIVNGRDECKLKEVVDKLQKSYGSNRVLGLSGDMAEEKDVQEICDKIGKKYGALDCLVANLGTGKPITEDKLDLDEWNHMTKMNLFSDVSLLRYSRPLLAEKGASIVLVSSLAACERIAAPPAYAVAKAGVSVLVSYLAPELAKKNVRINAVAPGNIYFHGGRWEELLKADESAVKEYIESDVPMKRFGTPEEIADTVVFLSSERAGFTTGTVMCVDGGQNRSL